MGYNRANRESLPIWITENVKKTNEKQAHDPKPTQSQRQVNPEKFKGRARADPELAQCRPKANLKQI